MIQEWFYIGAKFGFIGFFTLAICSALIIFTVGLLSLIVTIIKGGDDDGQP